MPLMRGRRLVVAGSRGVTAPLSGLPARCGPEPVCRYAGRGDTAYRRA
ncbi:MAG TPA: hypothetical protein PKC73_04890 [Dermatophilaceae bacterium]|nr:hypothetical protein [Dermatophilaceae bacterium]